MAHLSTARGVFFPMPVARLLWCPVPPAVPFGQLLARDWRRQAGQRIGDSGCRIQIFDGLTIISSLPWFYSDLMGFHGDVIHQNGKW